METVIAVVIVVAILALAVGYIYKAKKGGKVCIGCPDSGTCSAKSCACCCGCQREEN